VDWKWVVDNKLQFCGEVCHRTKTVKINLDVHEDSDEVLVDTFIHEQLHVAFPEMVEVDVQQTTRFIMAILDERQLDKVEKRYMKKLKKNA
jgi:hypothetical protein